jgi:Cohesin domain/PEP-CTERM motif
MSPQQFWQSCKRHLGGALVVVAMAAMATQPAVAVPVVSIVAAPDPAVVGTPVTLSVLINGVVDLAAYQFSLAFNPAVLQATTVTEGGFLGAGGSTFFGAGAINNTTGAIAFTFNSLIGAGPGVSGNGNLASITFNVISPGISLLAFSEVLFLNSLGVDVKPTVQNRSLTAVTVVPEPTTAAMCLLGLLGLAAWRRAQRA